MRELELRLVPPLEECGMKCVRTKPSLSESFVFFRCPHWHKERREVELPEDDDTTPPCAKLGLLLAPRVPAILTHEPALVCRTGVGNVWTD
eukprot:4243981-Amphidinium_carterae.1